MARSLCLALLFVGVCLAAFDPNNYPNSMEMMPRYTVYWRADTEANILYLALDVQTTGWVGFGIAEISSGSMPGSDIVTASVVDGVGIVTDRWAYDFVLPDVDTCQDWDLVSIAEVNGNTTVELKRAFNTGDGQDREIVAGPNRVVCAFGENGVDTVSYHDTNRITDAITFYGSLPLPDLPADVMYLDLRMGNYTVPSGETHYTCMSFEVPIDQEYHVIRIDPLIEEANILHVHHFLSHICENTTGGYVTKYATPGKCVSPIGNTGSGCISLMSAWAAGGGPTVLPEVAGFPMGAGNNSIHFIVLEVHYNNPNLTGGYTDHSGIRIWYTTQLRQYDAAMITLGDPAVRLPAIPPNTLTEYECECPSLCTNTFPFPINVFQSFPHMHEVGDEIWTTHWRNGTEIGQVGRVEYWSFDHQQSLFINVTIMPGDRLNTHCLYNTLGMSTPVTFGEATTDEMCMHFLSYYPRIIDTTGDVFPYCGYVAPTETVCGQYTGVSSLMAYPNPTIRDPPGGANRTFGVACDLETPSTTTGSTASTILASGAGFLSVILFVLMRIL